MPEKRLSCSGAHNNVPSKKKKKQRLSLDRPEVVEPELFTREAASDTALEIDIMILDYHAWAGTKCLIKTLYDSPPDALLRLERHLDIVNAWINLFRERHPAYHADYALDLRLALLRFCTLYFRRLEHGVHIPHLHELESLRTENHERAAQWILCHARLPSARYDEDCTDVFDDHLPFPQSVLEHHQRRNLTDMRIPPRSSDPNGNHFYGNLSSVSLLDILPSFMQICAAVLRKHDGVLETSVIELFCDFIRQACLEQYLVYGVAGTEAIDRAFAWGCFNERPIAQTKDWAIDNMFRDGDTGEERAVWTKSKDSVLDELMGDTPENATLQQRLETLAVEHPLAKLDASIRLCVNDLSNVIESPILVQLEQGQLKNLSPEATAAFLRDCDIEAGTFTSSISGSL